MAGSVQEHVGDMAGMVMDQTKRAPGQLQQMIEENPLITAALAATLGGVIGLALPSTQVENQLMGSARSQVMDRAHGGHQRDVGEGAGRRSGGSIYRHRAGARAGADRLTRVAHR